MCGRSGFAGAPTRRSTRTSTARAGSSRTPGKLEVDRPVSPRLRRLCVGAHSTRGLGSPISRRAGGGTWPIRSSSRGQPTTWIRSSPSLIAGDSSKPPLEPLPRYEQVLALVGQPLALTVGGPQVVLVRDPVAHHHVSLGADEQAEVQRPRPVVAALRLGVGQVRIDQVEQLGLHALVRVGAIEHEADRARHGAQATDHGGWRTRVTRENPTGQDSRGGNAHRIGHPAFGGATRDVSRCERKWTDRRS